MPYRRLRLRSTLASALAAGLVLAVASCTGHITPLGPDPAAALPQPHQLRSPLILQDMLTQGLVASPGGCPAGWVTLSGGCYRKTGMPVTITSAAVSPVFAFPPPTPPGQQAPPVQYGFSITVPAADVPALAARLGELLSNGQARAQLAERGRQVVRESYSATRMSEEYHRHYLSLLNETNYAHSSHH